MKPRDSYTLDLFAPQAIALPLPAQLAQWQAQGLLRQLDLAWARFVQAHDPQASDCLLLAAALLAHLEGRGHSCLPLAELLHQPQQVLGWGSEHEASLSAQWQQLPAQLPDWLQALARSPLVRTVGQSPDSGQPLVLAGSDSPQPLLYLRRYWHHERLVARHILARSQPHDNALNPQDEASARQWLARLFPDSADSASPEHATDWQKLACALALRGRLSLITGGPGTGKTYTAARLLALLFATSAQPEQLRVALAAPTGKAAARLKQSIDQALLGLQASLGTALDLAALLERTGAARTLHSLLGTRPDTRQLRHHSAQPLEVDVLIVDEASMIHLEMMAALLDALPPTARLILLGDKDQLASVEAGAVLGDLCRDAQAGRYSADTVAFAQRVARQPIAPAYQHSPPPAHAPALAQRTVMLRHSRRFGGPIGQLAAAVNAGDSAQALHLLRHCADGSLHLQQGQPVQHVWQLATQGYRDYAQALQHDWAADSARTGTDAASAHAAWARQVLTAFERFRLLCAVREGDWGVSGLNRAVEHALEQQGHIRKSGEWYAGRPVMVTRNDAALGVFNGDIGLTLPSASRNSTTSAASGSNASPALRVYFLDGEQLRSVGVARLAHVETAFAMTVHKSQGSEFAHTALVLPASAGGVLGRELLYTGITRAKERFSLLAQRPGLLRQAIASPTRRSSGLLRFLEQAFTLED